MILISGFVIDAALSEEHASEADVTEFPVEDGSTFTDNVRIKPRRYRMNGIVTDTPLDDGFRSIESDGSTIVITSSKPSAQAKKALDDIFEAKLPITIVTSLATYKNMVMQSLVFGQDGDTGDALPFSASFTQINVVQNVRRSVKVKFTAVDRGNLAAHPPGWIGTDKQGRDIVANKPGPGVDPTYTRADGTKVEPLEAADAARRQDSVLVKYDKDGHSIPVDQRDYQPYTPKQKKPYWAPNKRIPKAP